MDEIQKGMWVRTLWDPVKAREESPLIGNHEVKVAAYCRVSTDIEKQLHSLENQVQHYTHLIRSKPNWKFVGVYFDNGTSGRNATKQKGLQRLIRHCHEGRVDFILTKNVSRFTRNAEHLIKIVVELKGIGVGVYFEEQKVDTSVEYNQFLLSTYAALAQEEIETISASTKWGYEKSLQKGKPKFVATYGYRKITKDGQPTLEINEEQARVVRLIYDWFLQDWSIPDIKRELIRKEIPTMKGGKVWGTKNIKYMLQNPTYTGNKVARLHSTDLFTKQKTINKDDHITIENTHPAIISIDVFDRAQEKFSLDNKSPRKRTTPAEPHAFQKQIICQHCGKLIRIHKRKSGNIWRCNARNAGVCEGPELQEHQLRTMILEAFEKKFLEDENVQIGTLKKILTVANQQDHFEFHRLKWLTEMEMARTTDTDEELKKKEEAYRAFEEHIEGVEDGRPYRTNTIQWLDSIEDMETFYEQVTLEHFRAWVLSTSVTTERDYEVKWLDGTVTTIGTPLIKEIDSPSAEKSQTTKEVTSELKLLNVKGELMIEEKEIKKSSIPKREVQKIEPNNSKAILQTIEASMEGVNKQPSSHLNTKTALQTAAYCRVSTDRLEQQSSLKTQVAYYTYLILKNQNYQFAGIYADEGISGRSMKNRDELNRLIRECERGRIDVILVKSVSRLSRDIQDTLEITRYLRQLPNPTYIYFERENIWTSDPQADLMLSIFGSIAQEESIGMGRSMAWGIRSMAKRGIIHRKRPNYGYTIDDNYRWHIVKEEASVVRRIFREVRKGVTVAQIAVDLSEKKISTPTGNSTNWGTGTIKNILRNVVYKGDILFQQTIAVQNGRKKNIPNEGQEPQYYIEAHHEPIIPKKKWDEVQKILDERAEEVKKKRSAPLPEINENKNETFLEKMICGECSKQVVHYVNKRPKKNGDYYQHFWVCYRAGFPHYHVHDPCDSKGFKQDYFEQDFKHLLTNIYEDSTFYQKAERAIEQMDLTPEEKIEEEQLEREVKLLNQELYEVVDESLHGQGRDTERVDQMTEKLCAMYERLAAFRDRKEKVEEERKALKRFMKNLKAYIKNESKAFPSEIYTDVLKHAAVYKDGSVVYHLRFGLEWTTNEVYSTFKEQCEAQRWAKVKAKHEAFLRGPEVAALIDYCREPRTVKEMLAFMQQRVKIGKTKLVDRVVMPLWKEGTFERFLRKRENFREYLYYVKEAEK
ncbi:recombinase family protein [Solibacillus isronensis]|uniref:recombinase family protein n=1 Tax=Solibacillus isronensis TaxID=412383 RepID=UPI0009A5CC46|nr:recombinase family protein [Solibacillus isronensis]